MGASAQEYQNWRKSQMNNQTGIEYRYDVTKREDPEGKHKDCAYFVLDPLHDPYAALALRAYAKACKKNYKELANDINKWLKELNYCPNCTQVNGHRGRC